MSRRWVVNASPLILLGKIHRVSLLASLADELIVPRAVLREIDVKPDGKTLRTQLSGLQQVRIERGARVPLDIAGWDLGRGEAAVLAHARHLGECRAVLDDLEARRCAKSLGIPVIGTLGIVLRASRLGLVEAARPIIAQLRREGLYVSDALVEKALAHLDERKNPSGR